MLWKRDPEIDTDRSLVAPLASKIRIRKRLDTASAGVDTHRVWEQNEHEPTL